MTDPVKPRRIYRSSQRADQAAATRAAIARAARQLFIGKGWQATTIAGIARAAKVSPETVYAVFGSKAALFSEIVQLAVRRDQPGTPLLEQAGPQAVTGAPDQAHILRLFAHDIAHVLADVAPLMAVARGAADTEPVIGQIYRQLHEGRRRNLAAVASALRRAGPLRGGMGAEAATAIIWRLASPELFQLMIAVEGVELEAYADWLEHGLRAQLLP
ncbi:MAG: TetR/AcrR family transcriptional regulator [Hyphomicrobiales bacterium]|nr:MAG: TetR/AcrR family transcriptional regulator [Hyphomicrobiales bacterium]